LFFDVFGGVTAAEQVSEGVVAQGAVVAVFRGFADGADQGCVVYGQVGERLLAGQDAGGVPVPAGLGEEGLGAFDLERAGGVDEWEQVADLERQLVGDALIVWRDEALVAALPTRCSRHSAVRRRPPRSGSRRR
jgi:hypothetical protein